MTFMLASKKNSKISKKGIDFSTNRHYTMRVG
uniref:Uncharacterized protein n=1 Tax=Siphoviridae sp. ctgN495 TaxID=2825608 RepID=A0A8S5UCR8_9CAUD|nr:MAG TPA: hypothetical protein [Siphoviridae sp. ctgN495]